MNDQQLLHYYQHQQSQSGWFGLIHVMVETMVANVGEAQSRAFLVQMGDALGERFPLTLAHTVGEAVQGRLVPAVHRVLPAKQLPEALSELEEGGTIGKVVVRW